MATVRALLASLQDREKRTPTSVRHMLLDLASCCRCGDAKSTILTDGLEILLSLASDDQPLPANETLEILLELLVLLLLDNPKAKAEAARCGAFEVCVRCLHELSTSPKDGRRRAKILRRALELVDLLTHTVEAEQQEIQKLVVKQILEIMSHKEEETSVLLRATDTLGRFVDGNADRIQVAAKEDAIPILIGLLKLRGEKIDLKRTACDVLAILGEATGILQMMVSQNIIGALCLCLGMEISARELDIGVVRLLLRLSREAQVYGLIVHEEMIPLLFRAIERNSNIREVTATVCTIIADLSEFARQCKLDLSPFVDSSFCRGQVLVLAATSHAQDATVVDSTFRFFVNVSHNPMELPQLINSETIEGLLSLYVLAGGSGYLAELAGHIVQVISRLSRSAIEAFCVQEEDITLPALFLCLRNYHEDVRFAAQVFAILSKHWKTQTRSVQSITGYVGIAVELLCRVIPSSDSWKTETVEICNFIREMLLAKDGAEVVLSCGGKDLLEVLHTRLSPCKPNSLFDTDAPDASGEESFVGLYCEEQIAVTVMHMLEKAVLGCVDAEPSPESSANNPLTVECVRPGDSNYDEYVSKVFDTENHYRSETQNAEVQADNNNTNETVEAVCSYASCSILNEELLTPVTTENLQRDNDGVRATTPVESCEEEEEIKTTEYENDDDSEDDDEDDAEKTYSTADSVETIRVPSLCSFPQNNAQMLERKGSFSSKTTSHGAPSRFDHLEDKKWYYVDSSLVKYPKHPSRMDPDGQNNREEEFVLDDPGYMEPCDIPGAEGSSNFIEEAKARRLEFIADDVDSRARMVYENTAMMEDREHGDTTGIPTFLLNSCVVQNDTPYFVPPKTQAFDNTSTCLTFDSNFESANLGRAIRIGEFEYDLVLRHDFNSSGHMQWFYFAISNIQKPSRGSQKYRFNIVNLCKPNSLFNLGLQPVVYSVKDAHQKGKGWIRSGTDIYYFANPFLRPPRNASNFVGMAPTDTAPVPNTIASGSAATYYTLTFTLEFPNSDDTYLVAHSYPYTLTMHQTHLDRILHHSGHDSRQILRHTSLCKTLSGRSCDLLTISDFSGSHQELERRRAVFITARVHPGEAQASWMMRGAIDFLLGDSDVARVLRRMFVFQVIPIINPDGVYYGNSRCGLSACDLNRQWQNPSKALHPTIFHAKELLVKERLSRGVVFFCDMHGHSRKKNVFMYGCDTKRKPNPAARSFAKLFSTQQTAKRYISFPDCSFKVSKDKETTARVVVAHELKINWSFTIEASFCGANYGELQNTHFNTKHLHEVGISLCETLFQACVNDVSARERLVATVDDESLCFPKIVESFLREAGAVSDSSPVDDESASNARSSFHKGKKLLNDLTPKSTRRKSTKTAETGTSKVTDPNEGFGSGRRRKLSRQPSKAQTDGAVRDMPLASFVTDTVSSSLDLAYFPPPKLSGRKLRSKYPRVRRTKSSPDGHVKSRRRAIPSLSTGGATNADETGDRNERRGASFSSTEGAMPIVSPSKLSVAVPGPPSSSVRGYQNPESLYVSSPKSISFPYPSNVLGAQLRDQMMLTSPIGDIVTRSPKAPANRVRFRGAGRQFAAVSTVPKTSIHDILRSDSVTSFQSYEADLINASTIIIRQRTSAAAHNHSANSAASAVAENNPTSPSSSYVSFPSV